MKKSLVTGGAGFIGSHLVDRLLENNWEVTVLDNFSNGSPENLKQHKNNPNLTVVESDVANQAEIEKHFVGVEWVFHLASLADIVPSIQNPSAYHHSNVNGTISCLEAAKKANVKRFIYAASSSCYGIPEKYPTSEGSKISPEYPYALTKYIGEEYVMHWNKVYQLPCLSMRFFNVYGPRSRTSGTYGAVFGVFLAQKINNQPFTVVGDGTQTRDFTYVTDITSALYKAAESNYTGEIFNVGSGNTYSVNELVENLEGEVTYIPKRPGEPDCTFADISKITKMLDWKPEMKFEDGVKIMLENIDYWKNAPVWTKDSIDVATKEWHEHLGKN